MHSGWQRRVHVHGCVCMFMGLCAHVCVCAWACVRVCMGMCICMGESMGMCECAWACVHVHVMGACVHGRMCARVHGAAGLGAVPRSWSAAAAEDANPRRTRRFRFSSWRLAQGGGGAPVPHVPGAPSERAARGDPGLRASCGGSDLCPETCGSEAVPRGLRVGSSRRGGVQKAGRAQPLGFWRELPHIWGREGEPGI